MTTRLAGSAQSSGGVPHAIKPWRTPAVLVAVLLGAGADTPAADAATCAADLRPGATLFLPYFDVDLGDPQGRTTLFSVANASSSAILTQVTLWSDLAMPTLSFPVYLTGYDIETVNLRDVFDGRLPRTASAGQDPSDTLSPQGTCRWTSTSRAATASSHRPRSTRPPSPTCADEHRGLPSARRGGLCTSQPHGDQRVRGFVTIDTVNDCTLAHPADPQYFTVDATAQNELWGDFFYVDTTNAFAQSEALVRLQTDDFSAGQETFYGWLHGKSAIDRREPLPMTWMARFLDGGLFSAGTDVILWHAPGAAQPFACGPPDRPSDGSVHSVQRGRRRRDSSACFPGVPPPGCGFPFAFTVTGRTTMNEVDGVPTSFEFGALYIVGESPRQSWMGIVSSASGRFGVGVAATPLDTGCAPRSTLP